MEKVLSTMIEDEDGLILSLFFGEDTRFSWLGFHISRNPEYEDRAESNMYAYWWLKGPSVSWHNIEDFGHEDHFISQIELSRKVMTVQTPRENYSFDVTRLTFDEFRAAVSVLRRMNFDRIFQLVVTN